MVTLTLRAPMTISAGMMVEEFCEAVTEELDAITTPLVGGTFTVNVGTYDARYVKSIAKAKNFTVVSDEEHY